MKIVIAPDKFKGSLAAEEVCDAVEKGVRRIAPEAVIVKHPMGDGGEGTLDILASTLNLHKEELVVNDPLMRPVKSHYYYKNRIAYIELALSSGLSLLKRSERDVSSTTTHGTGELILDAVSAGCNDIYLMIGGSASNDAGIGILHALGYRFLNSKGDALEPVGKSLKSICEIDDQHLLVNPSTFSIKLICDVNNPFYGKDGAAYTYGRQKGIYSEADLKTLDDGLRNISKVLKHQFGVDISNISGTGAAGGVGGGLSAVLNCEILPGTVTLLELTGFRDKIVNADFIVTGEGKIDDQTLNGKVVQGIIDCCTKEKLPIGLVCGVKQTNYYDGFDNIYGPYPIKQDDISLEEAITSASEILSKRAAAMILEFTSAEKDP